jgi:hypothetical protein
MSPETKKTQATRFDPQEWLQEASAIRNRIDELITQSARTGDLGPVQEALAELRLKTVDFAKLLDEMQAPLREILGKNFLGPEAWKRGFGVQVVAPPAIPAQLTPELLNSACPLNPGQLIKDTHILMFIPSMVERKLYNALMLNEWCDKLRDWPLIYSDYFTQWRDTQWVQQLQERSEWILIPKNDPDPERVPDDKHFRGKSIAVQEKIHGVYYQQEYRQATTLEVITAAVLNYLVNGQRILPYNALRCAVPDPSDDQPCVGRWQLSGLKIFNFSAAGVSSVGRALVRKL